MTTKKTPTKKTLGKKRGPKPKVAVRKTGARRTYKSQSVQDYFCPKTGELMDPKWEMFCQVWVQTFDNIQACKAANYKLRDSNNKELVKSASDQARRLLVQEPIQLRVRAILKERVRDYAVTEDWVVLKLLEVIDKGMQEIPMTDREGNITGYQHSDLRTALGAIIKLGENMAMFQNKKDQDKQQTVVFNLNYGGEQQPEVKQVTHHPIPGEAQRLN